jgi:hypothetical protein
MAETKADAEASFDAFIEGYQTSLHTGVVDTIRQAGSIILGADLLIASATSLLKMGKTRSAPPWLARP